MYVNHIFRHASEAPDSLAMVFNGQEVSYADFARMVDGARNSLIKTPPPSDGVVAVLTHNLYHDWVLLFALWSLDYTTVAGTDWKTLQSLPIANIRSVVCLPGNPKAAAAAQARPDLAIIELPRVLRSSALEGKAPAPLGGKDDGAHIGYTSGTTGNFKALLTKCRNFEAMLDGSNAGLGGQMRKDDIFFGYSFGPWTAVGFRSTLRAIRLGATIIVDQRSDWPEHFFDYPVTMTNFVPGLLDQVLQSDLSRPAHYPELLVQISGGFLDVDLARNLKEKLGCSILVAFGGTEIRMVFTRLVQTDEDAIWLDPVPNVRFEIVDEDDCLVAAGTEGILRVPLAPHEPREYLGDPEATAKFFRNGFFYPGDMALCREDGRVRILGRVADVLNLAGQKIPIEPFELELRRMLGVSRLCAFVLQSEEGKEQLVVVIEGDRAPSQARLQAMARQFPQVGQLRVALMPEFPRGTNGMMKINRRKIIEQVRESSKTG